jgi:phosphate starvation-inducible PhoH-like protein
MGKKSKVIVTGDISQYDIPKNNIGLPGFINLMEGIRGVGHHKFTDQDIVRAKILKDVVAKYDKWRVDHDPVK